MAHTIKRGRDARGRIVDGSAVRSWHSRELKPARKSSARRARRIEAAMLATMSDPEALAIPRHPSTGGWLTH